jgi:hypothetical protein
VAASTLQSLARVRLVVPIPIRAPKPMPVGRARWPPITEQQPRGLQSTQSVWANQCLITPRRTGSARLVIRKTVKETIRASRHVAGAAASDSPIEAHVERVGLSRGAKRTPTLLAYCTFKTSGTQLSRTVTGQVVDPRAPSLPGVVLRGVE